MFKLYAVMFMDMETKRISTAAFYSPSASTACDAFRECYRRGDYKILAVAEVPE